MLYTTGTINDVNAAAVGLAMAERIRDDVVAHTAWELVEEFTPSSGAVRWYVFKCLATESGLPADYYVVMGRTLSTGELRFAITESYNSSTDTMQYFAGIGSSGTPAYDAQGRSPSTFVLGTTAFSNNNNTPQYSNWVPSGTSVNWWLIVDDDGFTVACNGPSNAFTHIGTYEPLGAMASAMPIQMIGSGGAGGIIRNPALANDSTSAPAGFFSGHQISGGGGTALSFGITTATSIGFQGNWQQNDKLQNNQRVMAEIGIVIAGGSTGYETHTGFALGKQKRMRGSSNNPPSGTAFGDTWALEGTLWVPYKPGDGRLFDTGVPV